MYCKDCRYDLRGLAANRCPECGAEFDPGDARTYDRFCSRIRGLAAPGIGARATIALLVLLIWSMTAFVAGGMFSGRFVVVNVWEWWPWNAVAFAGGVLVLMPVLLWVATERTAFLGLAIVTGILSVPFSFFMTLMFALQT